MTSLMSQILLTLVENWIKKYIIEITDITDISDIPEITKCTKFTFPLTSMKSPPALSSLLPQNDKMKVQEQGF